MITHKSTCAVYKGIGSMNYGEFITPPCDCYAAPLSEAVRLLARVVGEHNAPHDCYSTGPVTGTAYDDTCPSCEALRFLSTKQ